MANAPLCITTLSAKNPQFHKPLIDRVFKERLTAFSKSWSLGIKVMEFGLQSVWVCSPKSMSLTNTDDAINTFILKQLVFRHFCSGNEKYFSCASCH